MRKVIVVEGNRAKGSGSLVRIGKFWHARWMVHGKLYTRSTKCTDKDEAETKLAEFVKPFQEKTEIEVLENLQAKVRVQEKLAAETDKESTAQSQKWLKLKFIIDIYKNDLSATKIEESTELNYISIVNTLCREIKKEYISEVTKADATQFLEDYKKSGCVLRFNNALRFLKRAWRLAMEKDYRIKSNVWESFKFLKASNDSMRRELSQQELELLLDIAATSPHIPNNNEMLLLFKVGMYTGLRLSDCRSLKWSEIDFTTKMVRKLPKKTKKTGRIAIVPLHPGLEAELQKLEHTSEYVNPFANSCPSIRRYISRIFSEAGIPTSVVDENGHRHVVTSFHSLRTTFVTNCVRSGIPVPVIQKMVAHSNMSMTLHYSKVNEDDLRLPGFDESRVPLRRQTIEKLESAKPENVSLDDFLLELLDKHNKA